MWLLKTGRPARSIDDYPERYLQALLLKQDVMSAETAQMAMEWEEEKRRRAPDPDAPVITGDPEVDKWERQIAAGELPDWMKE